MHKNKVVLTILSKQRQGPSIQLCQTFNLEKVKNKKVAQIEQKNQKCAQLKNANCCVPF